VPDDENLEDEDEEKKRELARRGLQEEMYENEGSAYGQKAQDWRARLARTRQKRFGQRGGKGLGGKAGGAAGDAGKAGAQAAKAGAQAGLAAARAAAASAVAALGPWGIALVVILIVGAILAIVFWGVLSDTKQLGKTGHVEAQQRTIDTFLAYTGDESGLRKLILDKGNEIITGLTDLKSQINGLNVDAAKKNEAETKINEMIILIKNAKTLLSGTSGQIATGANDKINQILAKKSELQKALNLVSVSANGELILPLGITTCVAYTKKNDHHTAVAGGHGVWLRVPRDPSLPATKFGALDWYAPEGKAVYAIADGTIETIYKMHPDHKNWGFKFKSADGKYEAIYQHLARPTLSVGQTVTKGQVIGHLLRGAMKKPHLHFELWIGGYPNGQPLVEQEQRNFLCGGSQ